MENCQSNSGLEPSEGMGDSTPDDLRNISFDEWDRNFIASFEENVFNLTDDDGKNLGFLLSPFGKGKPLFLSPEGKRMSPGAFCKKFTPSPNLKYTPLMNSGVGQGMPGWHIPATGQPQCQELSDISQLSALTCQPKKQLFPSEVYIDEKFPVAGVSQPVPSEISVCEDILSKPWPTQGKLQAARSRFSEVLQIAVQKTADKVSELGAVSGYTESDVSVKHPELRQALGTQSVRNFESERNIRAGLSKKGSVTSKSNTSVSRKPYAKENSKRIPTYSRIQPKQVQAASFTLSHF